MSLKRNLVFLIALADCAIAAETQSQMQDLRKLMANQVDGVRFDNTDGAFGRAVVIRDGDIVPLGVLSLVSSGRQITTAQHVVFRHPSEKKKGHIERSVTDQLGRQFTSRGSDDGNIYFESFLHKGKKNLVALDLESARVGCVYSRTIETLGCDGIEASLTQNVFHLFRDERMYANLVGRTSTDVAIHQSKSHFFISKESYFYVFHEDCKDQVGEDPTGAQHRSLPSSIFFHNCPTSRGDSGGAFQWVGKSLHRYLVATHKAGTGRIRVARAAAGEHWVDIPKTGVLLTADRIALMNELFLEYLDEEGIKANHKSTWPMSAFSAK